MVENDYQISYLMTFQSFVDVLQKSMLFFITGWNLCSFKDAIYNYIIVFVCFFRFCKAVSNIEKMIPEVINLAFADVVTFQGGVRIWDFFHPMTKSKVSNAHSHVTS